MDTTLCMGTSETTGRDVVPGFAAMIAAARTALGWSMAELARRAGLSVNTVSAIEREIRAPSLRVGAALAEALDLPNLLRAPADPPPAPKTRRKT
jgi:transcriptional regulator with XRE-family HTH domain